MGERAQKPPVGNPVAKYPRRCEAREHRLQHTLPRSFQKIRYYGWMSPHSRLALDEVKWLVWLLLGWTFWLASGHAPQAVSGELGTVRCAACGGTMRIVAVCNQTWVALPEHSIAYLDSG